jgi:hypothetical protein
LAEVDLVLEAVLEAVLVVLYLVSETEYPRNHPRISTHIVTADGKLCPKVDAC